MIGKLEPNDTYKTIIIDGDGQDNEVFNLTGETIIKLHRFQPLGWSQSATTIFRGDGTVEIHEMTPFKDNNATKG